MFLVDWWYSALASLGESTMVSLPRDFEIPKMPHLYLFSDLALVYLFDGDVKFRIIDPTFSNTIT